MNAAAATVEPHIPVLLTPLIAACAPIVFSGKTGSMLT